MRSRLLCSGLLTVSLLLSAASVARGQEQGGHGGAGGHRGHAHPAHIRLHHFSVHLGDGFSVHLRVGGHGLVVHRLHDLRRVHVRHGRPGHHVVVHRFPGSGAVGLRASAGPDAADAGRVSPPRASTDTVEASARQAAGRTDSSSVATEACRLVTVHMAAATDYRIRLTPTALGVDDWAEARNALDVRLRDDANLVLRNSRGRGLIVPTSQVDGVDLGPCGAPPESGNGSGS